jgi:3-oxoacyl-(acyl-carrier-protein) synthase
MSLCIAGCGWITPLGGGVEVVWKKLLNGEKAEPQQIADQLNDRRYPVFLVPPTALKDLPANPRLRRSSAISRYAAVAGMDALGAARSTIGEIDMERVALVFAVSNGGVTYTKRFYRDLIASGAQSASPLLFPETVFNAPASHLGAILGINGTSYTLVGDGSVGVLAMKMAADLLESDDKLGYCLVVGAEEADWLLCDAYHKWRLLKRAAPIEPFHVPPRGTILSEGAGAVVVARTGPVAIEKFYSTVFMHRNEIESTWNEIARELKPTRSTIVIASANGTFVDAAEANSIRNHMSDAIVYAPKSALGESVGASGLWQTIVGTLALRTKQLPNQMVAESQNAFVFNCSVNQQASGLRLALR